MRFVVVTSEVTFVKENYNQFLEQVFSRFSEGIVALVVLKNNHPSLIFKGIGLWTLGAKETGKNLIKNSLKSNSKDHEKIAKKYHIPTVYFQGANDLDFLNYIKKQQIDLIVNARTRDIYKNKILKAPTLGCINIHHGLLPKYRGLMCDLYALYENRQAGFSIHKMETKIDSGHLIKVVPVSNLEFQNELNYSEHLYQSSIIEGEILADVLRTINLSRQIPFDKENSNEDVVQTGNPHFRLIRKMINKGMIL